ncbi:beta-N-acetylhexosaminidase [Parvibaculum sp. MBR-TMA-1.3b-4.2]|jgi:beta-N-acetylhexosaminidase
MTQQAAIYGCQGLTLTDDEKSFFRDAAPWGFIVFARNIETPDQLRALTASFRETVGYDAPVLIDQEGGRVARLKPPHWRRYPPGRAYGELYERDPEAGLTAARLGSQLMAAELTDVGIDVDCLPVLDVPVEGAHDIIGDRAYSTSAATVKAVAQAAAEGLLAGGVLPVIKHIPGHGRAGVDSHEKLPVVDASRETLGETDFVPFRTLSDMPIAMTAHVVYSAIDPDNPATTSAKVIREVIREDMRFFGLLMSDDLSMKALKGSLGERTRAALGAGCDMALHCNGDMAEMQAVAAEVPTLAGEAGARAETALRNWKKPPMGFDAETGYTRLQELLGLSLTA